jgi:hypothetical protein
MEENILEEGFSSENESMDKTIENDQSEELETLRKKVETLEKDKQTLSAQKEHFKEKFEKIAPREEKKEIPIPTTNLSPLEIVNLAKTLNNFSADEVEFIVKVAKSNNPADIIAASKDEWVNTAITSRREKTEKENKIPSSSSPTTGKNPIDSVRLANDKRVTDEELDRRTRDAFEQSRKNQGSASI